MYTGKNTITLYKEVEYFIPYKGVWFRFISGIEDETEIDMPIDIFFNYSVIRSLYLFRARSSTKSGN